MSLTGKDLLNTLQGLSEEELSRPVYVYADHGQDYYRADGIGIDETTTEYEYCLEDYSVHEEDRSEYDEEDLKKFILIS